MRISSTRVALRLILPLAATTLGLLACAQAQTTESSPAPSGAVTGQPQAGPLGPGAPCGGFAGTLCPDGQTCVDDPSDRCDPLTGALDCMGVCVEWLDNETSESHCEPTPSSGKRYVGHSPDMCARMKFGCDQGEEYFADGCGCGCLAKLPEAP